jgi:hypothetical protein
MAAKPSPPKWSQVKRVIGSWGPRELTDLVKDLFDLSPENREFLAARFAASGRKRTTKPPGPEAMDSTPLQQELVCSQNSASNSSPHRLSVR